MVQSKKIKHCKCGVDLPAQKTGRPMDRCESCRRELERDRQHEQYLKRKFKGLSEAERHLEELKADIFKSHRQELRHRKWLRYHLTRKFACSPGAERKARRMLRDCEEKRRFLGAPLRKKRRVSS